MEKLTRHEVMDTISRPHWTAILQALALHGPMAVKELASRLGMSYMGIKQHCQEMESGQLLVKRERKRKAGRPEYLFQPTPDVWDWFGRGEDHCAAFLIRTLAETHGPVAAERLVFAWFRTQAAQWNPRLPESWPERWEALAQCRREAGCVVATGREGRRPVMWEAFSPWGHLEQELPEAARLEIQSLSQLAGCGLEREKRERENLPALVIWRADWLFEEDTPAESPAEADAEPEEEIAEEEEPATADEAGQSLLF